MSRIQTGREIWYRSMQNTVRYYSGGDMSLDERVDYLTDDEDFMCLADPFKFFGLIISSIEHPILFTKSFYYSVRGFVDSL